MRTSVIISVIVVCMITILAQMNSDAAIVSALAGITMPEGAIQVTDADNLKVCGDQLQQLLAKAGKPQQCNGIEAYGWRPNESPQETLAKSLKTAGFTYTVLTEEKEEDGTLTTFLAIKAPLQIAGFWANGQDGHILSWGRLETSAATTASPPGKSGLEAAHTSQLIGVALPAGALRTTDANLLAAAREQLRQAGISGGETLEMLSWVTPGGGWAAGQKIIDALMSSVRKAGYRWQETPRKDDGVQLSSFSVLEKETRRIICSWQMNNTGISLVWVQLQGANDNPTAAGNGAPLPNGPLNGIYLALVYHYAPISGHGTNMEWLTFFPDGRVYRGLPDQGLAGFNYAGALNQRPDLCGTYTVVGNQVVIAQANGQTRFVRTQDGALRQLAAPTERMDFEHAACPAGLRLNNTYTRMGIGGEACITFTPDGQFQETMIRSNVRVWGSNDPNNGRFSGTYAIENYTLALHYPDGYELHLPFVIPSYANPRDPEVICLAGGERYYPANLHTTNVATTDLPAVAEANGIPGVYVSIKNVINWGTSYINSLEQEWVTFLPDGHFYWGIVENGWDGYNFAELERKDNPGGFIKCGSYTMNGNIITVQRAGGNPAFQREADGSLVQLNAQTKRTSYRRAYGGTGLKLNGRFYSAGGLSMPFIQFTPDGRFYELGALRSFNIFNAQGNLDVLTHYPGGKGTYIIKDYTLILQYDDQRIMKIAFLIPPGENPRNPKGIYLMATWFAKP